MSKEFEQLEDLILKVLETSLTAQLKAVRKLRQPETSADKFVTKKGMSQIKMVHAILHKEQAPLHINDIIARVESHFGIRIDRESIVSALSKKIRRNDRFCRVAKNTFALTEESQGHEGSAEKS